MAFTIDTSITQEKLDLFKRLYPATAENQEAMQALTLDQVQANTAGKPFDISRMLDLHPPTPGIAATAKFPPISPCEKAIANVVIDAVGFFMGCSDMSKLAPGAAEEVVEVAGTTFSKLETLIATISSDGESGLNKAKAVWAIVKTIYDAGCLGAVMSAVLKNLHWWDMVFYGLIGIATIVALCATDGLAFAAEIALLIFGGCVLVIDAVAAGEACSIAPAPPGPPPNPADICYGIRTVDGHFVTAMYGGGVGGNIAALDSDRTAVGPWEKFIKEVQPDGSFALQCANGQYVTANAGGGIKSSGDERAPFGTNATKIGDHEQFWIDDQPDGTIAIRTGLGRYVTAVNGGGWPTPGNTEPFRTDTPTVGPWEKFTLVVSTYGQ